MLRKIIAIELGIFFLAMLIPCAAIADTMLNWDASDGEVTGYRIYYGINQGGDTLKVLMRVMSLNIHFQRCP